MSQLSRNETRARLAQFSQQFADACDEVADSQTFWDKLFQCYGTNRREVAKYEKKIRKLDGNIGKIDLLWPGKVGVEQKSRGKSLEAAKDQLSNYIERLKPSERPRWAVVCDFARFEVEDLQTGEKIECTLEDLPERMETLGFLSGTEIKRPVDEAPINVEAVGRLGELYDAMKSSGYPDHDLQEFLVRILFCLFAEDTGVFEPDAFTDIIEERTNEDGSNMGVILNYAFETLNNDLNRRQSSLDEHLALLPYVNGKLFERRLAMSATDSSMRKALLKCTTFDWSKISPAIFGSLFQGVMNSAERRSRGAHYTGEDDIQKLIQPLFMEELWREFTAIRTGPKRGREAKLNAFHDKLSKLNFFDPACGCGNFLIVAYRELRTLEIEVLKELHPHGQRELDVTILSKLDVDQFHGIEIDEFPAQIARVALWLMDHVMNVELGHAFGQVYRRLPLTKSANIVHDNALQLHWANVVQPERCSYLLGNPPFVGGKYQTESQKRDLRAILGHLQNHGLLDYVTCWFIKAAEYITGTGIQCALVATNSTTQGEQVSVLWPYLQKKGIRINFAHRTFAWQSEARGRAHVHVVIVGFSRVDLPKKRIYAHDMPGKPIHEVARINPYLADGPDIVVGNRTKPLCNVPEIGIGNKPIDGGHYLFTPEEKAAFVAIEPDAGRFFRKWIGSREFINGIERWVLWLGHAAPTELRQLPECLKRIEAVKEFRLKSRSAGTQKIAAIPTRFHVENFPQGNYLVIPEVSSERREYIPFGYMGPEVVASNLVKVLPNATPYHFGILTSNMHMAWVRHVCGRLESRYRYSAKLVYNNFPWPQASQTQRERVVKLAHAVLEARTNHPGSTLADLYDPRTMPADLAKAHQALDVAVDKLYRRNGFANDMERFAHLIELYDRLANGSLVKAASKKRKRKGA